MRSRVLLASVIGILLLFGALPAALPAVDAQTPVEARDDGVYFVAYRTQRHIKYSAPDVFHRLVADLVEYLKSRDVRIVEDPERGILETDEAFSTDSLLNLARNAGAATLLLVTVDRPVTKWLKVTMQAYDLNAKLLWSEDASSGGGLSGGGAPAKVLKTLQKKLGSRIGKPGLSTTQPAEAVAPPVSVPVSAPPQNPPQEDVR
jgi:hypothetical protein